MSDARRALVVDDDASIRLLVKLIAEVNQAVWPGGTIQGV